MIALAVTSWLRLCRPPPPAGATYAVRNYTEIAGEVLRDGAANVQPNISACATSCDVMHNCTAFNWCGPGGCLADPSGTENIKGSCQLRTAATTFSGVGVLQVAADNPQLGQAGALWGPGPELAAAAQLGLCAVSCLLQLRHPGLLHRRASSHYIQLLAPAPLPCRSAHGHFRPRAGGRLRPLLRCISVV